MCHDKKILEVTNAALFAYEAHFKLCFTLIALLQAQGFHFCRHQLVVHPHWLCAYLNGLVAMIESTQEIFLPRFFFNTKKILISPAFNFVRWIEIHFVQPRIT